MTIDAPDDLAGLEMIPLLERERFQIAAAILSTAEIIWGSGITDMLEVSMHDRYAEMSVEQKRDVSRQLLWLLDLLRLDETDES